MGKLRNYILAGVLAGATTLGAYFMLRDDSTNLQKHEEYVSTEENPSAELKTHIIQPYVFNGKKIAPTPVVIKEKEKEKLREMPSFLEEILTNAEFNRDFENSLSQQLERLLVLCPQWRKPEYVSDYKAIFDKNGTPEKEIVEYSFEGMKIIETQSISFRNSETSLSHQIELRIVEPNMRKLKLLKYTLPFEDKGVQGSSWDAEMRNGDFYRTSIALKVNTREKPDSRNTYRVYKEISQGDIVTSGQNFPEEFDDANLPHNYWERVSDDLIKIVQNRIVGDFGNFMKTIPKKD